jgi:hypothetical protein
LATKFGGAKEVLTTVPLLPTFEENVQPDPLNVEMPQEIEGSRHDESILLIRESREVVKTIPPTTSQQALLDLQSLIVSLEEKGKRVRLVEEEQPGTSEDAIRVRRISTREIVETNIPGGAVDGIEGDLIAQLIEETVSDKASDAISEIGEISEIVADDHPGVQFLEGFNQRFNLDRPTDVLCLDPPPPSKKRKLNKEEKRKLQEKERLDNRERLQEYWKVTESAKRQRSVPSIDSSSSNASSEDPGRRPAFSASKDNAGRRVSRVNTSNSDRRETVQGIQKKIVSSEKTVIRRQPSALGGTTTFAEIQIASDAYNVSNRRATTSKQTAVLVPILPKPVLTGVAATTVGPIAGTTTTTTSRVSVVSTNFPRHAQGHTVYPTMHSGERGATFMADVGQIINANNRGGGRGVISTSYNASAGRGRGGGQPSSTTPSTARAGVTGIAGVTAAAAAKPSTSKK